MSTTVRWILLGGALVGLTLAALVIRWSSGERQAVDEAAAEGLWFSTPDAAFAQAAAENGPLVIVFHADWCSVCQRMERTTFQDAQVVERLRSVVSLKVDVDEQQGLVDYFGVTALPTTVVTTPTGEVVTFKVGYLDAAQFLAVLPESREAPPTP